MLQTHRVGEALPNIRVDFGPVLLGGLVGADTEIGAGTNWTLASINDDWSNAPNWAIPEDNRLWRMLRTLTEMVASDAAGRYVVCTPDLGGSGDVLLNLRGATPLAMDVIDQPDRIVQAQIAMYPAWRRAFSELYATTTRHGAALFHWLCLWSNRPYVIPACDFGFMVGPQQFRDLFMPDIARQAETVGRAVFHLDGAGATRHIDALLEVDAIQAIQYTPGSGTPSALAWVEMFRVIQERGRSLLIITPPEEVLPLCDALNPEGLGILLDGALSVGELDDLFSQVCRRYTG